MILIKKYEVRLFIILTHFKDGNWYKSHEASKIRRYRNFSAPSCLEIEREFYNKISKILLNLACQQPLVQN
jgi:hypothetical protein